VKDNYVLTTPASYAINTSTFMYSPTIRSQYAYRHPTAPESVVQFNDFLFAAHGAFMCVILYSQFYTWIWGFKASKGALGIFWGCVLAILVTVFLAHVAGKDSGYDPSGWAWIDVVSQDM
jgi:cystinosin